MHFSNYHNIECQPVSSHSEIFLYIMVHTYIHNGKGNGEPLSTKG